MKKVFLTLALAAFAFAANAQFVIGGNLGVNFGSVKNTADGKVIADKFSTTNFGIDLKGGYQINDDMQVGLTLGYATITNKTQLPKPLDPEAELGINKSNTNLFYVGPYFRYNFCEIGSAFTFFAEASLRFGFGGSTSEPYSLPKTESKVFALDLAVVPGVNYKLSDKVSFDLYLNFIELGWHMTKNTAVDALGTGKDYVVTDNAFGLGFQTSGMAIDDLTRDITIGFNYHF